jgi:arylsulfatase
MKSASLHTQWLLRLCCLLLFPGVLPAAEGRPNFILVITDDQGYGPIGRHGHPWIRTPHLDALYDQSTRFTRFLVAPTCAPTRAALMTGRHDMRNGVTHTILERERMTLAATTLPQALAEVGYGSGIFGKWHLGDEAEYQPEQRGFQEVFIHGAGGIGQAYDCSCADVPDNSYFNPVLRHNGRFVKTEGYCTDLFFTAALGWIDQQVRSGQPYFAYISTNAPHSPYHAPEKNVQRFKELGFTDDQAGFYGMIENIDENMGRLLSYMEQHRLFENTVLIFMSDNGMTGGGSGVPGQAMGHLPDGTPLLPYNAGMKGLKGSPDEGGVRVPFFVRADGRFNPGRDIDRIAAHIDLFPTFAELAGAQLPPGQVEGRSLLPLLKDATADWPDRLLVTHVGRWPTGADPDEYQWKNFSLRTQQYRLVNNTALFDMQADPGQTRNVIAEHPEVVDSLRKQYTEWWQATRPLMVNEAAPLSPVRPYHEWYRQQLATEGIPAWQPPLIELGKQN